MDNVSCKHKNHDSSSCFPTTHCWNHLPSASLVHTVVQACCGCLDSWGACSLCDVDWGKNEFCQHERKNGFCWHQLYVPEKGKQDGSRQISVGCDLICTVVQALLEKTDEFCVPNPVAWNLDFLEAQSSF